MLNDTRIRATKPCKRPIKLSDSGGLYLLIAPHGSKLWRLAYRFGGKKRTLALGVYPTFTLKAAREKREEAKRLLANGIDPSVQRRLDKQITSIGNTFKAVAEEVLAKLKKEGRADGATGLPWPRSSSALLAATDARIIRLHREFEPIDCSFGMKCAPAPGPPSAHQWGRLD